VSDSLGGYYHSRVVGGITYRLFHHNAVMRAHATVSPNKYGQCVKFEVNITRVPWHASVSTKCASLDSSSKVSGNFGRLMLIGFHPDPCRLHPQQQGHHNLSNDGAWHI
jgi:hypothetical protein